LLSLIEASDHGPVTGQLFHQERLTTLYVGATGLAPRVGVKIPQLPETNQGVPSMSKGMETNAAAMYLRKSTEDDGRSVGQQAGELRIRVGQLAVAV
jgi:hypothetical protein